MASPARLAAAQHIFVDSPNGPLHAVDFGGEGTPLVCIHGVTGSAWAWHDVAAGLSPRRVISVDMRGHGDSAWSTNHAYDTADMVSDLTRQITAFDAPTIDLAGSSWGALVALEYCAANPGRVNRLALVDIEPSFDVPDTDVPPRPQQFESYAAVADWVRESNPRAPSDAVDAMTYGAFARSAADVVVPKHDPELFSRWPFRNGDHWASLDKVECPTLLVHAGFTFVRGEVMEKMQARIADSSLVEIAEAGHVVPVDNPVALADALRAFLEP